MDEQPKDQNNSRQNFPQFLPPKQPKNAVVIVVLIAVALVFGVMALRNYLEARQISQGSGYLKPKSFSLLQSVTNFLFNSGGSSLETDPNERVNILLLGIGGSGHEGPYLSDTNIILSIKPASGEVAMISVPRDLMAKIDGHGYRKINAADAFGEAERIGSGGDYARQIFEDTFSMKIPYYIRVDFTAFQEIIDAMGGVTVNVERPFTDNSFPGPGFSYETVSFASGTQTMNGEQALIFARSRHGNNGEGSDFARAKRQQIILAALKQKALSSETYLNPVTVKTIFDSISEHVTTNMDFGQLMYLAGLAKQMNGDIKTLVLDDTPNGFLKPITSEDGAFMLVPKTDSFTKIDEAINDVFEATSTQYIATPLQESKPAQVAILPSANVEIQNGTWRLGLAARTRQDLEDMGVGVSSISNCYMRPVSTTAIYVLNPKAPADVLKKLSDHFNIQPTTILPDWLQKDYDTSASSTEAATTTAAASSTAAGAPKYKANTEILIILGEDTPE